MQNRHIAYGGKNQMKNFFKNYGFITSMLAGIAAGCLFGWFFQQFQKLVAAFLIHSFR